MSDKVVSFDMDALRSSIYSEIKEDIEREVYFDVYYGVFRDMPINVLCEQFMRMYKGTDVDYDSINEKGFCLMYSIVLKTCEYLRDSHVNLFNTDS